MRLLGRYLFGELGTRNTSKSMTSTNFSVCTYSVRVCVCPSACWGKKKKKSTKKSGVGCCENFYEEQQILCWGGGNLRDWGGNR